VPCLSEPHLGSRARGRSGLQKNTAGCAMNDPRTTLSYPSEKLTPREVDVMTWTARGKTRAEISVILSISEETVKDYITNACRKLDAVNKTQAAAKALVFGLILPFHEQPIIHCLPE